MRDITNSITSLMTKHGADTKDLQDVNYYQVRFDKKKFEYERLNKKAREEVENYDSED